MEHRTTAQLLEGLTAVATSPSDEGVLALIALRPTPGARVVATTATLSVEEGVVGDGWRQRGSRHTSDGTAEPERQVTIANIRALDLVAGDRDRVPLAGDQLYVDLDLSAENLPTGTRLHLGEAVLEISAAPHTGCAKFADRFGMDAARLANSPEGRRWNVRGINARVVRSGTIRVGDRITLTRCLPSTSA